MTASPTAIQDAARVNTEMETADQITPRLSVKAAFYLNDVSNALRTTAQNSAMAMDWQWTGTRLL